MTTKASRGEKIFDWIAAGLDEGRTVYVATYARVIKIQPKHRNLVRLHNGHCEVARGKSWDSINYCKITADFEE